MRTVKTVTDTPKQVQVIEQQDKWHGHILDIKNDVIKLTPDAAPIEREYVKHPGAVGIVALRHGEDGRDYICLVNQYRHAVGHTLWEIPAGLLDIEGENELHAAQRELAEEASLGAHTWHVLVDLYTTPGASSEGLRVFLARDVYPREIDFQREDEERDMEAVWISLEDAYHAVSEGRIHNPSAIVGILSTMAARDNHWATLRTTDEHWQR